MLLGKAPAQNLGFSMVEVMVGVGLLGLVALAGGQVVSVYTHSNNSANSIDDWTKFKGTVEALLEDPATCASALGVGHPGAPNLNGFNLKGNTVFVNTLYGDNGQPLDLTRFPSLKIQNMQLKGSGNFNGVVDAELVIEAKKMNNQSSKTAVAKLEALPEGSIFLELSLNPNGSFKSCSTLRTASEYCQLPGYSIVMDPSGPRCHRVSCPSNNPAVVGVDNNYNVICCRELGMQLTSSGNKCVCPFGQDWTGGKCVNTGNKQWGTRAPAADVVPASVTNHSCPTGPCRPGMAL